MKKEFKLSEERKEIMVRIRPFVSKDTLFEIMEVIENQDKEFIRLLKEEMNLSDLYFKADQKELYFEIHRIIDNLAGDLK